MTMFTGLLIQPSDAFAAPALTAELLIHPVAARTTTVEWTFYSVFKLY